MLTNKQVTLLALLIGAVEWDHEEVEEDLCAVCCLEPHEVRDMVAQAKDELKTMWAHAQGISYEKAQSEFITRVLAQEQEHDDTEDDDDDQE
jgi:hypothetical protein